MNEQSESIKELAQALSEFQSNLGSVKKDKTANVRSKKGEGASYQYKYVNLATVWDEIREPLHKAGLSIIQAPQFDERGDRLVTTLMHKSGQWVRSSVRLPHKDQGDPQALGSSITYMRRYSLMSLLGIVTDDDDGAAAARPPRRDAGWERPSSPKQQAAPTEPTEGGISAEEAAALQEEISGAGKRDAVIFAMTCVKRNLKALSDLKPEEATLVREKLAA